MKQKLKYVLLMCLLLTVAHLTEGKRSLSGRSRTSSSSSRSSPRRTSTQTHYSPPPSSSNSGSKPSISHAPNSDHVKLTYGTNSQPNKPSYGWNVPQTGVNKPSVNAGPPPAYSPHNVAGGARTNIHEPPPAYKPNNAPPPAYPGNNQPIASYPKQTYNTASGVPHQSGAGYPYGAGTGVHHNTGFRPHNGTGGGFHSPIYAHTVRPVQAGTYQQGPLQPGFYPHQTGGIHPAPMPVGGFPAGVHPAPMPYGGFPSGVHPVGSGGFSYPQQSAPVFAGSGVQPGFYPAGSFPKSSSGPGLGTGLIAGALGGAILGHALTPSHSHHHVVQSPATNDGQDRIIIINNSPGQPATVTNAAGQPVSGVNVIQNGGQPATNTGTNYVPEAPVPLAPFPNTQQQAQPGASGGSQGPVPVVPAGTAGSAGTSGASPDGIVPLAPFPQNTNNNGTEQPNAQQPGNANGTQPMYGTYCVPVLVNVTDPNNTANVTTVEQVYCYAVEYPPQQMAPASNTSSPQQQQQPDLMQMSGNYNPPSNDISNIPTQRTSTASLAANSNIKSGTDGFISKSNAITETIIMTVIAFTVSSYMR